MIFCIVSEYYFIHCYRTLFGSNPVVCYSVNIVNLVCHIFILLYNVHYVTESDQVRIESERVSASTSLSPGAASMLFTACETVYVIVITNNMDCKSYTDFLLLSAV